MSDHNQIRDAVIKLEAKMEVMSDSMSTMAEAVSKLADLRYELKAIKKDTVIIETRVNKHDEEISGIKDAQRVSERQIDQNSFIVKKVDAFIVALITGGAGFLWWLLK